MKKIFAAGLATVIFISDKNADAVPTKVVARANGVDLVLSGFAPVGTGAAPDLIQATLSAVAIDPNSVLTSFSGEIGSNGALHHEQFSFGPPITAAITTPTAESAGDSSVDSHFVVSQGAVVDAPSEWTGVGFDGDGLHGTWSGEPGDFNASGFVEFGPSLSGDFAFGGQDFGRSVDIAQLVAVNGMLVEFKDLVIGASETERAADFGSGEFLFSPVPEPSSGLLAAGSLAWLCYGRRGD